MIQSDINKKPGITGTFLQLWLASNWDDQDWQRELQILNEAGIEYLIVCPVNESIDGSYSAYYPTNIPQLKDAYTGLDVMEACFRNCAKAGIRVFVGMSGSDKWWVIYSVYKEWLFAQMELGNAIASELYTRYKDKYVNVFYGWYWVWELFNMPLVSKYHYGRQEQINILVKAININLKHLTYLDPSMPLILSPYANDKLTDVDDHRQFWKEFINMAQLRSGDILCPQDAVGAGWTSINNLDKWFKAYYEALEQRPDIHLWANNENFVQEDWSSATLDRFVLQLKITDKYVENHITFSYNHYYSPQNIYKGFHKEYIHYKKSGEITNRSLSAPNNLVVENSINYTKILHWEYPGDEDNVAGYTVYRDNVKIGSQKRKRKDTKSFIPLLERSFFDLYMTNENVLYQVEAFDFAGNISPRTEVRIKR